MTIANTPLVEVNLTGASRICQRVEAAVRLTLEVAASLIVAIEIVVLSAGVTARLVGTPLLWTDEVASILFLWLAILGACLASARGQHMRMTAFTRIAGPAGERIAEIVASAIAFAFLVLLLPAAVEYAHEESYITTTALEISNAWRAAALPVGMIFMAVTSALHLVRLARPHVLIAMLAGAVAVCWGLSFLAGDLRELGNINLLIFFVGGVGVFVFAGIPIAFAFGMATFAYISLTTQLPAMVVVGRMDEGMSHLILLAVPLFVFLGLLIEMTGMAKAMVAFLASLLGHVRGGLSYVLIGAMYLVSGISGSKAADMAAVAPVLFPEMEKRGADRGELVALLAATGAQTETVPPSLVLITIGSVTGVSIAALFTGGLLPAAVLGALLSAMVWYRHRGDTHTGPQVKAARWSDVGKTFVVALPALALPFIIRAAVVEGVATATEVSTIGVGYSAVVGLLIYRRFEWARLFPMLTQTAALSGAILLIIGTATAMAWALTQSGFSQELASAMGALPGGTFAFLLVSILAFIVLGSVLEGIPAIVLFGPLLFPIAREMGIHEVHYSMVVVLAMGLGLFAPPFGVGYYSACAIVGISPDKGIKPIFGYLLVLLIGLIIVAGIPWISIGFL
ncbi:TRAP transporter large permease subunit [Brucella pseudogrignonensis]